MARADLLVKLLKEGSQGDVASFRRTAESLITEERSKKHNILAERLTESLRNGYRNLPKRNRETYTEGNEFLYESEPRRRMADMFLSDSARQLCREIVEEQHRSDLLRSYGLEPRNRIMLTGPPGNGKTSLAEALAYDLMVPLLSVRYETLIGSFLGETAGRLQKTFDHAKTMRCVLFFDEFDTIGKERGDQKEMGEIKRVVSSLLLQMDRLPSHVIVVTASNHPELLDRAVWRRFQIRLDLPVPTESQTEEFVISFFEKRQISLKYPTKITKHLSKLSFAELEEFCTDVLRRSILEQQSGNLISIIHRKIDQWSQRDRVKLLSASQA